MSKTIEIPLSAIGVKTLESELNKYMAEVNKKCARICYRLAELGIEVGQANSGDYSPFIAFRKHIIFGDETGYVILASGEPLEVVWYTDEKLTNEKSNVINPLLMAEFGSGFMSTNPWNLEGVGQGTLPNAEGHAFDPKGWFWYGDDGNKYHSIGQTATQPLYTAWKEMLMSVKTIAQEEFAK